MAFGLKSFESYDKICWGNYIWKERAQIMRKNRLVAPVVKWVGGKRQLLDDLTPLFPKRITSYGGSRL